MQSLVTPEWLAGEAGAPDLRILDATAHLPATGRDAAGEYAAGHIPGARFLDLASLVDSDSPIENTLPTAADFAARIAALGISDGDRVVLYDDSEVKTSARAWFLFWMHGKGNVAILDGGLAGWKAMGGRLDSVTAATAPGHFTASAPALPPLRTKQQVLALLTDGGEQLVDARGAPRFTGAEAESRPGIASGHIPGSRNLPYKALFDADGGWKSPEAIRAAFTGAGIDLDRPVVTSCGSGLTACVLVFGLHLIGKRDVALYDGSWTEWGADPATPKATGPA